MKNVFYFTVLASFIFSTTKVNADDSKHSVFLEVGSLDFQWNEYDESNDFLSIEEKVDETGSLASFSIGYSFQQDQYRFDAAVSRTSGKVDYYGEIAIPNRGGFKEYSSTNYEIYNIEASYGKYFDVDYIKPFAAFLGGYTERKRNFVGIPNYVIPSPPYQVVDVPPYNENMAFLYWGVLLDVEVFSWNGFSANLGGEFNRSFNTKLDVVEDDIELDLESLVTYKLMASAHYQFLNYWKASLLFEDIRSKMDQSYPVDGSYQPESEEHHRYLALRITKSF